MDQPTAAPDFYLLALMGLSLASAALVGLGGAIARFRGWLTRRRLREPFQLPSSGWRRADPRDWQRAFHEDARHRR